MDTIQPLLDQLAAISPAWAAVVGLVAWALRQNGWLRWPGAGADPLKARLQDRIGARYDELSSGGFPEEAFYWLYSKVQEDKKDATG